LVFSVGFRATGPQNSPYIVYFLTGYVAWAFLLDVTSSCATLLASYSYLIRKSMFSIESVMATKLLVSLVEHVIFLLVVVAVVSAHGMWPGWGLLRLVYGFPMLLGIIVGLMLLLSAANVLYPDLGQLISIMLNVWFWMTPIAWVAQSINPAFRVVLDWNPIVNVIDIYRQALAYGAPVVISERSVLVYWIAAPAALIVGGMLHLRWRSAAVDAL
jgi:ABC-type polysaccharide/polyol phosphate export permease